MNVSKDGEDMRKHKKDTTAHDASVSAIDYGSASAHQIRLYDHWAELKWRSLYVVLALLVAGYNGFVFGEGLINLSWVLVNMYTMDVAYNSLIMDIESVIRLSSNSSLQLIEAKTSLVTNSEHAVCGYNADYVSALLSQSGELRLVAELSKAAHDINISVESARLGVIDNLIYTEITEGLWSRLWVASYVSISVSVPLVIYNLYTFIKPGLLWLEAYRLRQIIWAFILLLVVAHLVSFSLIIPRASAYLLNYQTLSTLGDALVVSDLNNRIGGELINSASAQALLDRSASTTYGSNLGLSDTKQSSLSLVSSTNVAQIERSALMSSFDIKYLGKVQSWVEFLISVNKYVIIAFELPLFLLLLGAIGLKLSVNSSTTKSVIAVYLTPFHRKLLLFSLTIIAAISSPPDIISLFLVLLPLVFIVELTILISIYLELVVEVSTARI